MEPEEVKVITFFYGYMTRERERALISVAMTIPSCDS